MVASPEGEQIQKSLRMGGLTVSSLEDNEPVHSSDFGEAMVRTV